MHHCPGNAGGRRADLTHHPPVETRSLVPTQDGDPGRLKYRRQCAKDMEAVDGHGVPATLLLERKVAHHVLQAAAFQAIHDVQDRGLADPRSTGMGNVVLRHGNRPARSVVFRMTKIVLQPDGPMAELRIAISTPQYPLAGQPARAPFLHRIVRELARHADVRVFLGEAAGLRRPRGTTTTMMERHQEIDILRVPYPSIPGLSRIWNGRSVAGALLAPLRDFAPDVILGYWIYPEGYGAWRCARTLDIPCVLGGLGTDIRLPGFATRHLTGQALRGAQQTIMVSEEMRRRTIADFGVEPARVHTIPNGVDTRLFFPRDRHALRAELSLPDAMKLIVYVGRLVHTKGLRELLEAFRTLAGTDQSLHLALVGGGPLADEIARFSAEHALNSRIHLPGAVAGATVATWIGAGDLLCLPSYSEGHPNVLVEALASGRPVVATNVGGIPEIVNDKNGVLVAPRDSHALRSALEAALARTWRLSDLVSDTPRTWSDVAAETLEVCRAAIAQHPSP